MRRLGIVSIVTFILPAFLAAQLDPEGSHVNLYFPHFADGGTPAQQWQTSFTFVNPSSATTATAILLLYGNNGLPLSLDLGTGPTSQLSFSVPPLGTKTFRSKVASSTIVTGWAIAYSTLPLQATVQFRLIENGKSKSQISAAGTLPSALYRSPANRDLGVAIANVYSDTSLKLQVAAYDTQGNQVGTGYVTVGPLGHSSFNLFQVIPGLPDSYSGSVAILSPSSSLQFVAWTLGSEAGVISSLPQGELRWPISHFDRIWLVYRKVFSAAQTTLSSLGTGVSLTNPPLTLNVDSDPVINAFATSDGNAVHLELALSELISDSPSEMAFVAGHELGHIIQTRSKTFFFTPSNKELDADQWGMLLAMVAGFDPYAGAGALSKISMAMGDTSLVSQVFDNLTDIHTSFTNRITVMFSLLTAICGDPQWSGFCAEYRSVIHPHFPSTVPLGKGSPPN